MAVLKQFWTPCFWYHEVNQAVYAISYYTAMMAIIMITYTCYVLNGGESSQYYMPYFEADRASSLPWMGGFVIIFMIALFFASIGVVQGVKIENRGLLLPWLSLISCIILYQAMLGFWLFWAYYIYLETVLFVLIYWLWMSYNIYAWLAVYSMYEEIRIRQAPNFNYIYP